MNPTNFPGRMKEKRLIALANLKKQLKLTEKSDKTALGQNKIEYITELIQKLTERTI